MIYIGAKKWSRPGITLAIILQCVARSIFSFWALFSSDRSFERSSILLFGSDICICESYLQLFYLFYVALFLHKVLTSTKALFSQMVETGCLIAFFIRQILM